jgi:hypothetical protein
VFLGQLLDDLVEPYEAFDVQLGTFCPMLLVSALTKVAGSRSRAVSGHLETARPRYFATSILSPRSYSGFGTPISQ